MVQGYFKMGNLLCRIIFDTSLFMCIIHVPFFIHAVTGHRIINALVMRINSQEFCFCFRISSNQEGGYFVGRPSEGIQVPQLLFKETLSEGFHVRELSARKVLECCSGCMYPDNGLD